MYSQRQTSVITSISGAACLASRTAWAMMPSGLVESLPTASFAAGIPKRITPPNPRSRRTRISSTSSSGENWKLPGIEAISCRTPLPGRTKSGITRFAGERRVCRASCRTAGL